MEGGRGRVHAAFHRVGRLPSQEAGGAEEVRPSRGQQASSLTESREVVREKPHERYRERRGNVLCSRCVLFSVLQVHVHLMDTLKESLEGIQDKVTYQQHGKSLMQNYAGSHWQQRSCTSPSSHGYVKHKTQVLAPRVARLVDAAEWSSLSESPYRKTAKMAMISKLSSKHSK